jgi:myo-inositol-1(or 4)-monophosphatase
MDAASLTRRELQGYEKFAVSLAEKAGRIMRRHFMSAAQNYAIKDDLTPLSIADTSINAMVVRSVRRYFPGHSVLGEEESHSGSRRAVWVCDPIDGTYPYTHGIPTSTFNLAYTHDGQPLVAVTYDPFMKRLYHAIKGHGAYLNGKKIKLPKLQSAGQGLVSVEVWNGGNSVITHPQAETQLKEMVVKAGQNPIYLCSVAYASMLVASGQANGVVFGGCKPWDGAAISLIVSEAGGLVTDLRGRQQRYDQNTFGFIAARPEWHDRLVQMVRPFIKKDR